MIRFIFLFCFLLSLGLRAQLIPGGYYSGIEIINDTTVVQRNTNFFGNTSTYFYSPQDSLFASNYTLYDKNKGILMDSLFYTNWPFALDSAKMYYYWQHIAPVAILPLNNRLFCIASSYTEASQYFYRGGDFLSFSAYSSLHGPLFKQREILIDTTAYSMASIRHSNGRDWWVVKKKAISNLFYKILVTPDFSFPVFTQNVGNVIVNNNYVQTLSPSLDGKQVVVNGRLTIPIKAMVEIYNFNRRFGQLDFKKKIENEFGYRSSKAVIANDTFLTILCEGNNNLWYIKRFLNDQYLTAYDSIIVPTYSDSTYYGYTIIRDFLSQIRH